MASTNAKVAPQLNAYHKLFIHDFVSRMEKTLKENFEERGRKEMKEHEI